MNKKMIVVGVVVVVLVGIFVIGGMVVVFDCKFG